MADSPQYAGMSQSSDRNVREMQENIRILQSELSRVAGVASSSSVVSAPVTGNNFESKKLEQLRWEFDHLQISEEAAGDTYASYFKATYDTGGAVIDISTGYSLFPTLSEFAPTTVSIDTSTNGTHYIYLLAQNDSGSWSYVYGEDTSLNYTLFDYIPYVIAQVDVVDNAIDDSTIIQHQFGWLENTAACREVRYRGQFAVMPTSSALGIFIANGSIVYGTGTTSTGGTDTLTSTTGTHYVFVEISYSSGIVVDIDESTTYPVNDATYERFVIAEVDVSGGEITDIRQQHTGEFSSVRIWP